MTESKNEPEIVTLQPTPVALYREVVPMNALAEFFGRAYAALTSTLGQQGVQVRGPAMAVYYNSPTDTVDVAAAFPTDRLATADGKVTSEMLPAGRAAQIVHVGSYDSMGPTYGRLMAWVGEQGLSGGSLTWETYLTEPTPGGNQDSMLTRITWPLAE